MIRQPAGSAPGADGQIAARRWPRPPGLVLRSLVGPLSRPSVALSGIIGAAFVVALVWFDLGVPLAFNDDFLFAWSVRQLGAGHGLRMLPEQAPLAIVQVLWGTLVGLGHADPRILRLSAVPFVLMAAGGVYYLARRLGADRPWALLASVSLLAAPFFSSVATTFMTDAFYAGLVVAAAVTGVRWVEDGKTRWTCCALILLAGLERQNGVAIAAALTIALFAARARRTVTRREWLTLGGLWLAGGLVLLLPSAFGLHTGAHRFAGLLTANPFRLLRAASYLAPLLGLMLAPLLVGLAFAVRPRGPTRSWPVLLSIVLAEIGVLNLAVAATSGLHLLKKPFWNGGSYWSVSALSPAMPYGHKPAIYPLALFVLVQGIALATFLVILVMHRRQWTGPRLGPPGLFLMALAGTQLLPMLQGDVYDRYFIPVIAPLIPLVAAIASRSVRPRLAGAWAYGVLALWLGLYVAGEQDYQAWEAARDRAAQLAYQQVPPFQVDAGYEANAVYWEIPLYERTGMPVGRQPSDVYGEPSVVGPPQPRLRLEFAGPDDPRPGVSYRSLAPGRIIIVPLP